MLFVTFYFAASIWAGLLLTQLLFPGQPLRYRLIAVVVLAQTAVLLPVHLVAALELVGLVEHVGIANLAIGQTLLLCGVLACHRRFQTVVARPTTTETPWDCPNYLRVVAAIVGGAYLVGAVNALTSYIREFDAVRYHLLLPLRWSIDGTFSINSATDWRMSMPANAEASMFVILLGDLESLLSLVQWGPLICLAASVYCLSLSLSKSRDAAWMCVAVLLTVPIVYFQAFSGYVDTFALAFVAAAMAFGERSLEHPNERVVSKWRWLVMAGVSCGLAIGTKQVYLAFGGLICACLVVLHVQSGRRAISSGGRAVVTLLGGLAIPSAFWYLRAALQTGNPLYPLGVRIGDYVLFDGLATGQINGANWAIGRWVGSEVGWLVYPWVEYESNGSLARYSVDSGLGAVVATFVPLGVLFFLWLAVRRRVDKTLWLWLVSLVICGLVWWFPLHQTLRFGLVPVVMAVVMTAPLLATLSAGQPRLFRGLFTVTVLVACSVIALEPASSVASRIIFDRWARAQIFRYPTLVDELPNGATILSFEATRNIAMAGSGLNHRVVGSFELPRNPVDEDLIAHDIDFIVGRRRHQERVKQLEAIELIHREEIVDPVGGGTETWSIWKVNRVN